MFLFNKLQVDDKREFMTLNMLSAIKPSKFDWFFKYKLYHLPFWFAYHYMWWTLTIGSVSQVFDNIFHSPLAFKFLFAMVFQAIGVYFNLYFLIPKFLEKGKYALYVVSLILTIICTASFLVLGYYATAAASEKTFQEIFNMSPDNYIYIIKANSLPSTVASMTLAMSLKLTKNSIQARQKQQTLEKEKLETELKFLRSQFNPHFLFNTINSIFVLIHKNPDMASESLAKFSDLLRYQLYECNEHQIALKQELGYVQNFIELQQLRKNSDNLWLIADLDAQHLPDLTIAPFVLIPFIENAFKHVSQQKDKENWIRIHLNVQQNQLHFKVANSIAVHGDVTVDLIKYGGIGLTNVRRRLNLIYPGEHNLLIEQDKMQFSVTLNIDLHQKEVDEKALQMMEA